MLQTFQQPVKPESNCHLPVHAVPTHVPNVGAGLNVVAPQPAAPAEPCQQKTAFDKVAKAPPACPTWGSGSTIDSCASCPRLRSQKLLDRFDYDDEPEASEESKKDEVALQQTL